MICARCHRPLRLPSPDGFGPVCRKSVKPIPVHECDLFGFDIEKAVQGARHQNRVRIESLAFEVHQAVHAGFEQSRERLGVSG